ncbi:hypothetical protein Pfo_015627 [Paulownia fortunei]|nr:hypothetical protein Pfo_015627 [Paulownia fortunei]
MEGGDQSLGNGPGGSRWNPTKEQISMLESLYRQGLRTPTAEQIQQITIRLRDFGHIEGKNVFYWFQNHKARQRQKQKQENFAYFNRFLHATPVFPRYQNVVCSPCYMPPPKNDPGFYQQYPKVPLPAAAGGFKRSRLIPESIDTRYNKSMHDPRSKNEEYLQFISSTKQHSSHHQETLDLFPIHPTGLLQARNGTENENKNSTSANTPSSSDNDCCIFGNYEGAGKNGTDDDHPFFDFFCGN